MAQDFTVDRNSPKWVLGADGYLKEYANDEAAIEFNADGSYKGVLVEPQSINLCLQSEDINTTWTPSNATPTQSTETTPDGDSTNKYIKLVDDGNGGSSIVSVQQTITGLTAGGIYTASIFAKADTLDYIFMFMQDIDGATDATRYFDLVNGTSSGGGSYISFDIKEYPNGWYRCSITFQMGASDTVMDFRIYLAEGVGDISIPRDGTNSVYLWGAQLEESPIATSYIPTTTGAVTRLKDDIYLTSASSLIGQTEGTLFVEVDWNEIAGGSQYVFQLTDGTTDNRIHLHKFNTPSDLLYFFIESGNVAQMSQGVSSTSFTGIQKIAFAYKQNDCKGYINGSEVVSDTSVDLSSLSLTELYFGQNLSALVQGNMWIRAVALFTTRLSDAEAYSLTGYDTYAQMANALQYTIL